MADGSADDSGAGWLAAWEKAWWRDMTGLVRETDQQLVVIGPRPDATADDLRSLGQALVRWTAGFPEARHIWGLTDLLEGRCPRTPPVYLQIPFSTERLEDRYEPVALVHVAEGTNVEAATRSLFEQLGGLRTKVAWFTPPDVYSACMR